MVEILAPAGNEQCALAALNAGADAIYLGLSAFSARVGCENFDLTAFSSIAKRAHILGARVFVAMNTLQKDDETEEFLKTLVSVWNAGADAIILQDLFLGKAIHEKYPNITLHLSTQAGVCSLSGAKLAKEYGFSRVILARETPITEIEKITKEIETETFVQGALCTCFSGQCYFSSFVGGNSGNRGRCKQPCRKKYSVSRSGFENPSYFISLSDLSVGERIFDLVNVGVSSFKIEGRMRRPEYVAAAVKYYKKLLSRGNASEEFTALKRAYNRGNYTQGLAFGQDKRLLSSKVQGHIGEKVGVVKVENGKYVVSSGFTPRSGDGFKILRGGEELCGASFLAKTRGGFCLQTKTRLKAGDSVFLTTDTASNERILNGEKKREIELSLRFVEGEKACVSCGNLRLETETVLESAQTRPLTENELRSCFEKTDGLPFLVRFLSVELSKNVFIVKSALNELRRQFFALLEKKLSKNRVKTEFEPIEKQLKIGKNEKRAVICSDDTFCSAKNVDVLIFKPKNYLALTEEKIGFLQDFHGEKYLYMPCFSTSDDEETLAKIVQTQGFDGVYSENVSGIEFARKYGVSLFAGTGFNLTNRISVATLLENPEVRYYAVSKELSRAEQNALCAQNGFALLSGDLKLMDLCYCPFEKTCPKCDKKELYDLFDENNRKFTLRRYVSPSGNCRFEIYNCANLLGEIGEQGELFDFTITPVKTLPETIEKQKEIYEKYTNGHAKESVL